MELRHTAEGTNRTYLLFSHLKTRRCRTHFYDCLLSAPPFAVTQTFMHTACVMAPCLAEERWWQRECGGCMFYQTAALICRSAQEAKHSRSQGFYRCLKLHWGWFKAVLEYDQNILAIRGCRAVSIQVFNFLNTWKVSSPAMKTDLSCFVHF